MILGNQGWVYPVGAKLPEVSFSVGDDEKCMVVIGKHNMNHSEVEPGFIFGAIQENPAYDTGGLQFDIFGTPFLRQVYAIFDCKGVRFRVVKHELEQQSAEEMVEEPQEMDEEIVEESIDGSTRDVSAKIPS